MTEDSDIKYKIALASVAQEFDYLGFKAFFELIHGVPLHREGEKWAKNVFKAWGGNKKLLQKAFRGSGKSTVLSKIFVAFFIGHHPYTTNGIIRVTKTKADETVKEIAELIDNDIHWKLVFPHVQPDKDRGWGEKAGFFIKRTDITSAEWKDIQRAHTRPLGASLIGYGYDSGSIQGFRTSGILLIDDIHVKENTRSDRQLADVKDFVAYQLLKIPVPEQCLEMWCYTPWLTNDAYAVREQTGLYILSESPAMVRADDCEHQGEEKCDLCGAYYWPEDIEGLEGRVFPFAKQWWHLGWAERFGIKQLAIEFIDGGPIAFAREFLLDLEATKGQRLKKDWISYYPAGDILPSWPVYLGVDYASVADKLKHKDRDYFALAMMRAVPGGGLVLVGGYRGHTLKSEAIDVVKQYQDQYPSLKQIAVEAIGKGEEFYNDLALTKDMFGKPLKLVKIKSHKASKGERFEENLAPKFAAHRIWVSDGISDFIDYFLNEWLMYPNSEHDDCLDAVYMAALAGEGATPTKAQRTFGKEKSVNPFSNADSW